MAITAPHYRIMRDLASFLPKGGSLLEIGEANWYGDIDPEEAGDISQLDRKAGGFWFNVCKVFYDSVFAPSKSVAIDKTGSKDALRYDLNCPVPLDEQFDVVINHGTAEHIFDIAQVFETMHDRCSVGGMMIHDAPFTGWIDHGFYTLQPTLFYDVGKANNYEVFRVFVTGIDPPTVTRVEHRDHVAMLAAEGKIPRNSNLFVVLRKWCDQPFVIPTQAYYANALSEAGRKAWEVLR